MTRIPRIPTALPEVEAAQSARRGFLLGGAGALFLANASRAKAAQPENGVVKRLSPQPGLADHTPLIQDALNEIEAAGGGRLELSGGVFLCASSLYLNPMTTSLVGDRAVLDFTKLPAAAATALLISPPANSTAYGQATQRLEGISLVGPGRASSRAGILFRADQPGLSSRLALYNIDISGFADGLRFEDRAYLTQIYSTAIRDCENCVMVPKNLQDAGENIAFFGCTISAASCGINNEGGFEFNFFGTSFDFIDQWYSGTGLVNFYGCHFETARPSSSAPLFAVADDGILVFHGGYIMVSGNNFDPSPKNEAVFQLDGPRARAILKDTFVYNLRSAAGVLAAGQGRLVTQGVNGGAVKEIDAVPMRTAQADLFGGTGEFRDEKILLEADISSDAIQDTNRYASRYGTLNLESGAVRLSKTGGLGNELKARFFCPISPLRMPSIELKWKAFGNAQAAETIFWITLTAVQKIGMDRLGKAIIGASESLGPLQTLRARFDQAQDWLDLKINTLALDPHLPTDGLTSEWVTHLCIGIELINFPEESGILVSELHAYAL